MTIEAGEFRRALGCFPTGVTVIAARQADGTPRGFTANSFSSVSLHPPLISICIDRRAASIEVFRHCSAFAVNVLSGAQRAVSDLFAGKAPDKFERVAWHAGETGAPLIDASVASFECRPYRALDAGDHLLLIGEVLHISASDARPLGFCRGSYLDFELQQSAVIRPHSELTRVGCILDYADSVLLLRVEQNIWALPAGNSRDASDPAGLHAVLRELGIDAQIGFLFSVFEGPRPRELSIFYRGEIVAAPALPEGARLFPHDQIPWHALPSDADRSMLRRYVEERRLYRFGIYVGSAESGAVAHLADDAP